MPLEKLLKLAILSAYIKGDMSFSVVVIAEPELKKTQTLLKFRNVPNIKVETDLTYYGLVESILPQVVNNQIRTIIIPDLLKPISKKQSTAANFTTSINALIEEGIYEITLHTTKNFNGARCNILTSITPDIYFDKRRSLSKIGWFTRIVPFSFRYTDEKTKEVRKKIRNYERETQQVEVQLPTYPQEITIGKDALDYAESAAVELGKKEEYIWKGYTVKGSRGFRHQWHFQAMLKAAALERGSPSVEPEDINTIKKIARWINFDFNPL